MLTAVVAALLGAGWILVGRRPGAQDRTGAAGTALAAAATPRSGEEPPIDVQPSPPLGKGTAALERAASADKYLFLFFHRNGEESGGELRKLFDDTMRTIADRADSLLVDLSDPGEEGIVEKFGLRGAPTPLVLSVAPNGAVTGGFQKSFTREQLLGALTSPGLEKSLKALQERKLVLLCVQGKTTSRNDEAMAGVRAFGSDPRYAPASEIVLVDPKDPGERKTMESLKVDPKTDQASTILILPPGVAVARFEGATDKKSLEAALRKATSRSSCGPNAAPGCCPPKK